MIQLHHGDCLEFMKGMEDNSVDAVITDPPYGIDINKKANNYGKVTGLSRKATEHKWDNIIPGPEYFNEIMRVSKNQIIFGANYFWESFYSTSCYIIWDKRDDMPDVPFCDTEFAWTSFTDRPSKRYIVRNHGFVKDSKEAKTGHPTQKPLVVIANIVNDFTCIGSAVFDPFMGSGTTGVACAKLGRSFIGCELDPEYYAIAKQRIENTERDERNVDTFLQGKLFNKEES